MLLVRGEVVFVVVSVLVAATVAEFLHEASGGVAEVEGNGFVAGEFGVCLCAVIGGVGRVRFGGTSEVDGGFGERQTGFGHAEEVGSLLTGDGEGEGVRVCKANVLGSEDDEAAGDEEGVFAGFEHAGEPVEGAVRV